MIFLRSLLPDFWKFTDVVDRQTGDNMKILPFNCNEGECKRSDRNLAIWHGIGLR